MACWGVKLATAHPPLSRIQSTLITGRSIQVAFLPIIAIFFGIYLASPAARLDLIRCFTIRIDFEFAESSPCLLGKTLSAPNPRSRGGCKFMYRHIHLPSLQSSSNYQLFVRTMAFLIFMTPALVFAMPSKEPPPSGVVVPTSGLVNAALIAGMGSQKHDVARRCIARQRGH